MGPLGGFWPKLGRKRVTGWKQRSCVPPGRVMKTNKQTNKMSTFFVKNIDTDTGKNGRNIEISIPIFFDIETLISYQDTTKRRFSYLHGNSFSAKQSTSHCCLELTRPLFFAYLSIAKPFTFSNVQALSQDFAPAKQTFWMYKVKTGN
jgi:hypothetical protein